MNNERENPWDVKKTRFRNRPASPPRRGPAASPPSGDTRSSGNQRRSSGGSGGSGASGSGSGDAPEEASVNVPTSGRLLAWSIIQSHDQTDRFLQDLFAEADSTHSLESRERAAAVDIAAGVVRHRRTIDALLQSQITKPRHQIEADLWRTLRMGVYQLVFGKTPDHAAVDSTVDLCRQLQRERWTRFVNGVLRGVGRLLTEQYSSSPAANALPVHPGEYRILTQPVFADPSTQPAAYVADAFSLPDSLAVRWAGRMAPQDLFTCCFYAADVPRTTLRVNRLRSSTVEVTAMLEEQGCQVQRASIPQSLSIESGRRIEKLPGFSLGYWTVQDESASAAALLLKPRPGERILDLCAAPGGKTTHLAELSDDAAHITACDVSDDRLARVDQNATRLGLQSITLHRVDRNGDNVPPGPFDAILVDVPCSNTGVLCRRPEARWRFNETDLAELIQLQTRLLLSACERVAPGGRIVYSTCSLEPEENRGVVDSALRAFPKFQIVTEQTHRAGDPADGAYQVLLVRPEQNM